MHGPALPETPEDGVASLGTSLHRRHVTMIAIGGIIGAGLFVGSSTAIATTGPAAVISYMLAGFIILIIMRMLAEMAASSPGVASFTDLIGIGLGPVGGFVAGWLYWFFWVVVVAIEAIAAAAIVGEWLGINSAVLGAVILAAMTATNLLSTRIYGETEFWLSSMKVAAIIGFIVVAAHFILTAPAGSALPFHGFGDAAAFAPSGSLAILAGVTTVIFALCGAEIATIAAAESPEPEKVIARLTISVALRILLFYAVSIAMIVAIVPWRSIVPGYSPFATALAQMGIPGAATIMNLVVLIAVLSCLNSGLYVTSRVAFGMARHGDAPAWLVAVNRRHVPVRSILLCSAFGYVALAASALSPTMIFTFLINASGGTMLILYAMLAVAQIRLRRRLERTAPDQLKLRMWLFPWLSYATIAIIVAVMAAMTLAADTAVQLVTSLGVAGLSWILGAIMVRKRAG